ncbi:MAG: SDR family oxidoreductase [Polyangiaceae bacterium]|nr:SDR family oxidoreductase [Polyangiaceae bacterium]
MPRISAGKVLVTGASRGIGRAVVELLLDRGASVAAVGREEDALVKLARRDPSRVTVIIGDVSDPSQRDRIVENAASALGGLDGLVCSAGIARHQALGLIDQATVERQLAVNFVAPLMLSQDAARTMRLERKGGAIVHVSSTLALRPAPGTVVYGATKAALNALTRGLAAELAPDRIRVNAVLPGIVDTDMARAPRLAPGEAMPVGEALDERVDAQLEGFRSLHPLGRLGHASEVAEAVVHLLDAEWTTGTLMVVDGGLTL